MLRVEIEWHDTGLMAANDSWTSKDKVGSFKTGTVFTCGYLLMESETDVMVALSWDKEHDQYYAVQVILKKAIANMTVLRARKEHA
jgi:hypothetical protein